MIGLCSGIAFLGVYGRRRAGAVPSESSTCQSPRRRPSRVTFETSRCEATVVALVCEFHSPEPFLSALLAAGCLSAFEWPTWLRRRLLDQLALRLQSLADDFLQPRAAELARNTCSV